MQKNIFFCLLIVSLASCQKDASSYFSTVVYKTDPANPELPQYSELGLNTFGAYYNDFVWKSPIAPNSTFVHYSNTDSLIIEFKGIKNSTSVVLSMSIAGANVPVLTRLNDQRFSLPDPNISIQINSSSCTVDSGYVYFKKCKKFFVDSLQIGTTFSGIFDIAGTVDNKKIRFKDGRFDFLNNIK